MADWLPDDHLAWFLIDAVEAMDTTAFHSRRARAQVSQGRAGFDPDMLVTLLLYAYAHEVRSSRRIERLCATDVAFRVICAQDAPDHTTIARFRAEHEAAFTQLFTQVLIVCATAGLGRVGSIAVDGTKIAANASLDANRTEDKLRAALQIELEAELEREAERIVAAAAATDAAEDAAFGDQRGDELPPSLRGRGGGRVKRIRECLAQIETETTERTEQRAAADARADATLQAARDRVERAENEARAKTQAWQDTWATVPADRRGRVPRRRRPPVNVENSQRVRLARERLAKAEQRFTEREARLAAAQQATVKKQQDAPRRNITDPDSRIMPTRKGWIQGYNAQIAVTDDHLILAATITQDTVDTAQAEPMTTAALDAAAIIKHHRPTPATSNDPGTNPDPDPHHGIGLILFDAGYLSENNLTTPGPDRLIALGKHRDQTRSAATNPTSGPPAEDATAIEQMSHRLRTPEGHRTYKRRGATVEPVIGHLKAQTGLRRFSRRGLTAATSELNLAAAVVNLLKLHTHTHHPAT